MHNATPVSIRMPFAVLLLLCRVAADSTAPGKEFLCKMTEKMQADVPPGRQAGFVRCCLNIPHHVSKCKMLMPEKLHLDRLYKLRKKCYNQDSSIR